MIDKIWRLELRGSPLGVRVLTKDKRYCDIAIDVYKEKVYSNLNNLEPLPLIEHGNLLATREELTKGHFIEEISKDDPILATVKNHVRMEFERNVKKKNKYRDEYRNLIPSKWRAEFIDYHLANFENRKGIYDTLNAKQFKVIKDYFRWRTRAIFNEQRGSQVLRKNFKKVGALVDLMDGKDDWVYDGTVDTGHSTRGKCQLGHPLRYEHYAYSPSLDKQLIFGSTCVADFFEIDSSILRDIQRGLEVILREVKVIIFILNTGKHQEYKESYNQLWGVMKHFKGQFNNLIPNGAGWSRYMGGFDSNGLPLTYSMVLTYEKLLKLYNQSHKTDELTERINKVIEDTKSSLLNPERVYKILHEKYSTNLSRFLRVYLLIGDYYNATLIQGVKIIDGLGEVQEKLMPRLLNEKQFRNKVTQNYPFIVNSDGRRLATRQELDSSHPDLVREPYLGREKTKYLLLLLKYTDVFTPLGLPTIPTEVPDYMQSYINEYRKQSGDISKAILWGLHDSFEDELKVFDSEISLPITPEGETKETKTLLDQYDFILANTHKLTEKEEQAIKRIPRHAVEQGKSENFIKGVYARTLRRVNPEKAKEEEQKRQEENEVQEVDEALTQDMERIIEAGATGKLGPGHFAFTIIPIVQRTGRVSYKQRRFIEDALRRIRK